MDISGEERIEVNAAMQDIIASGTSINLKAARAIIKLGARLPMGRRVSSDYCHSETGGDTTGHTTEGFDVSAHDSGDTHKEGSTWVYKERVGEFKIWRRYDPSTTSGAVAFQHFWQAEITTRADDDQRPDTYCVRYYLKTLEPISFGKEVLEECFKFLILLVNLLIFLFYKVTHPGFKVISSFRVMRSRMVDMWENRRT